MVKKIFIKVWEIIKRTYLYKNFEWLYGKTIHILFVGKWMPKILAYGGIHFLVLIALGYKAYDMWNDLEKNNVTSFNQIIYRFYGDTLQNYQINYLKFEKDMRRRPDNTFNPNDINFYYGFSKKDSVEKDLNTVPITSKYLNGDCDLVSKVRYFTCNDLPDSINRRVKISSDTIHKIIYELKNLTNHERYYFDKSMLEDTSKIYHHTTNAMDHLIEWDTSKPCFSFWIGFIFDDCKELNKESVIRIKFNEFEKNIASNGYRRPLIVEKVSPTPTLNNLQEIVFKGEELKEVIKQRGIYISGVDPEKKEIIEKKNIRSSVLLGTIIAFMLDIIVQLVLKWRKLKEYKTKS